ncbi:MAG: NAD(P)H nitroreductase [Clostridiaceae bacterium]|nr:NAD(P)H nitroreductase [Clostridiaceae bacterium]
MRMLEMLFRRRSIRKYKNIPLERERIEKLIKAALLAPSSRGIRPWEFIIVESKQTLKLLSEAKESGSEFLADAPFAVVVIADETKSDVWIEDAAISSVIIQLEAEKLGLGSCWVQIRNRKTANGESSESYVKKVLDIPFHYRVECIIAAGYPAERKKPYSQDDLLMEKVHYEKY